jgi:Ca2+-transporting ATPase
MQSTGHTAVMNHFVMNGGPVTILKDGEYINIEAANLKIGDRILLQVGDLVPADIILAEVNGLEIDEFDLNGEIMPVSKQGGSSDGIAYMGSRVISGSGEGIVVAIGEQTEYGKIIKQEWEHDKPLKFPAFKKQYLILAGILLPAFVLLFIHLKFNLTLIAFYFLAPLALIILQNDNLFSFLLITNENKRLQRLGIQIRDPKQLERWNEIDIICFDKTGVLTTRQMEIAQLFYVDQALNAEIFRSESLGFPEGISSLTTLACALCHDVYYIEKLEMGSSIDKALISFAINNHVDVSQLLQQSKRIYEKPFDSENRYMACGYEIEGKAYYFAKGDPSVVLKMCRKYLNLDGSENLLDADFYLQNRRNVDAITKNGDTAIALAYSSSNPEQNLKEYTYLCLLRLENPLHASTIDTIKKITTYKVKSLLVTGDRAETAIRIGIESGISPDSKAVLNGTAIERMNWYDVASQSAYCSVFARLTPSQKGLLILRLQQAGHKIAMVGDGPNDGVAMKLADIGVSLTKNSSIIARRLANILITDLPDIVKLLHAAKWIKTSANVLKLIRILIIACTIVAAYGWFFITK